MNACGEYRMVLMIHTSRAGLMHSVGWQHVTGSRCIEKTNKGEVK